MVDVSPSCVNRRRQNAGMPVIAHEEKTALSNPDSDRRPQDSKTLNLRDNFILFRTLGGYGLFISWIIRL